VRKDQPRSAGILVEAAEVARIHGNRISEVASAEESACIDIVPPSGIIEVTNNIIEIDEIGAFTLIDGAGRPEGLPWHCYAIRVAGTPGGFTVVPSFLATDVTPIAAAVNPTDPARLASARTFDASSQPSTTNNDIALWTDQPWITFLPSKSMLLIRANDMRCKGFLHPDKPMVLVEDHGARCTFGGNICVSLITFEAQLQIGVRLHAYTVVADSNQIQGTSLRHVVPTTGVVSGGIALDITTTRSATAWTVLGNIVDGRITVTTNAPLPPPWLQLNRMFEE
jgi:hypothetical protein